MMSVRKMIIECTEGMTDSTKLEYLMNVLNALKNKDKTITEIFEREHQCMLNCRILLNGYH